MTKEEELLNKLIDIEEKLSEIYVELYDYHDYDYPGGISKDMGIERNLKDFESVLDDIRKTILVEIGE